MDITPDNRHQLIHVHQAGQIITDGRFMGLDRGREQVVIQITLRRGRSPQAKRDLYARIADLAAAQSIRRPARRIA